MKYTRCFKVLIYRTVMYILHLQLENIFKTLINIINKDQMYFSSIYFNFKHVKQMNNTITLNIKTFTVPVSWKIFIWNA